MGRGGKRGVDGKRGITICFSCVDEGGGLCPLSKWDEPRRANSNPSSTCNKITTENSPITHNKTDANK